MNFLRNYSPASQFVASKSCRCYGKLWFLIGLELHEEAYHHDFEFIQDLKS